MRSIFYLISFVACLGLILLLSVFDEKTMADPLPTRKPEVILPPVKPHIKHVATEKSELSRSLSTCMKYLSSLDVAYEIQGERQKGECSITDQVLLKKSSVMYSIPIITTCPLLSALAAWEQYALNPLAEKYFNSRVKSVDIYAIFVCRDVKGANGRRSQHAYGNAIDVGGFRLMNGDYISILNHWDGHKDKSNFLKDLSVASCRYFNLVLGPEYNAAHHNHFHLDIGDYHACK